MAEKAASTLVMVIVSGVIGILGGVFGAVSTGWINAELQERHLRARAILESFQFDYKKYPVEILQLKQFNDEVRNLSIASVATVHGLAEVHRANPNCATKITDQCEVVLVKTIGLMRDELGSGRASPEEIRAILRPKYEQAQKAMERLSRH